MMLNNQMDSFANNVCLEFPLFSVHQEFPNEINLNNQRTNKHFVSMRGNSKNKLPLQEIDDMSDLIN